jgi:predicted MFS family arabinose efflux permease
VGVRRLVAAGVAPISALLTTRAPAEVRPKVVAAFLSITSAGVPLGAAVTTYAIAAFGFRATFGAVAAAMTLSTLLLLWCVRRASAVPDAVPAVSLS